MTPHDHIHSLFASIDAGHAAQRELRERIKTIVKLAREVEKRQAAAIPDRAIDRWKALEPDVGSIFEATQLSTRVVGAMASGADSTVLVTIRDTFRSEDTDYLCRIPYHWLWANDTELTALLEEELKRLCTARQAELDAETAKEEAEAREQLAALKERFESASPQEATDTVGGT